MVRHGGKTKWKDMKKMAIHKPKKEAAEGTNVADTLLLQLDLQNYEKNKLLFFKPPSSWYFATAALTNSYKDWQNYWYLFIYSISLSPYVLRPYYMLVALARW